MGPDTVPLNVCCRLRGHPFDPLSLPAASASGYSSKFLSKAAVKGGGLNRKWAYKGITKSGKLVRVRRQAPHMAGQVRAGRGWGGQGAGVVQWLGFRAITEIHAQWAGCRCDCLQWPRRVL